MGDPDLGNPAQVPEPKLEAWHPTRMGRVVEAQGRIRQKMGDNGRMSATRCLATDRIVVQYKDLYFELGLESAHGQKLLKCNGCGSSA